MAMFAQDTQAAEMQASKLAIGLVRDIPMVATDELLQYPTCGLNFGTDSDIIV